MAKKKTKKNPSGVTAATEGNRKPSQRQLDKLDREILKFLNHRAELTIERTKDDKLGDGHPPIEDATDLKVLIKQNPGPLQDDSVKAIFRELISGTYCAVHRTRVSFLGPEFTYSHLAAIERFGQSAELIPVGTIASVFEEVELGQAEYGLAPIENSTDGRVVDALECLAHSPVKICGEVPLRIRHCLLGMGTRSEVERVYSKPQALSQCRNWISKHLPDAQLLEVASTALAAQQAACDGKSAAIGSRQASVNYSLAVLARNIEDNPDNVTRFAVIGKESGQRTGHDKTALLFEIDHQPGALADAMGIFKRQRLNMTWIESFPVPGQRGRYLFLVEFQGHESDLRARRALASLQKKAVRLTVLGSYAQAEPIG